jgi:NADH-quinone oxidoreductase subunit M
MIGLPMLSGFVGEFIILSSTFAGVSRPWAVAAAVGIILGAAYMLSLVQRIFYGPESALTASKPSTDLGLGELAILTPLVVLMLVMGLAPNFWLNTIRTGVHPPPTTSLPVRSSVILSGGSPPRRTAGVEGSAVAFKTAETTTQPSSEAQR